MIPARSAPFWLQALFLLVMMCTATLGTCPQRCYCTLRTASCTSPTFPLILPSRILKLKITGIIGDLPKNSIVLPKGEQLKSLTLQSASVNDVKPSAFSDHHMKEIIFDRTVFGIIQENAFKNCTAQTVYFRQSTIEIVAKGAFSGLTSENFHLLLTNITTIESGAFNSLNLSEALTFNLCHLREVKELAFNVTFPLMFSMNTLDNFETDPSTFVMFSYNRLNCTCDLKWLWSSKYDYRDDLGYNKCASPAPLKNVYLDTINTSKLCSDENS